MALSLSVTEGTPGMRSPDFVVGVPVTVPMFSVSSVSAAEAVNVAEAPGARDSMKPMLPSLSSVTNTLTSGARPVLVTL